MAVKALCKINGCDKPAFGRGWCGMHYARWQHHGDPLGGRVPNGEAERHLHEVVLAYDGVDCLIWPFQRDKKGNARFDKDGRSQLVARLVCIEENGLPPTEEHEAAHSCGKAHDGCVAKRHLSWKTHKENIADKFSHGTTMRGELAPSVKLTEADVLAIRKLKGTASQEKIAAMYGVTRSNIGAIHARKSWYWLE